MFELVFGFVWLLITAPVTFAFFLSTDQADTNIVAVLLFLSVFWIIGILMLIKGLIKVIRNILTAKNGKYYIGKIIEVYPSGNSVNGRSLYNAEITFYIDSENEIKTLKETVGYSEDKYPIGSYVKVKYYKNDINIIEAIEDESLVPYKLKDIKVDNDEDIIEQNGHKYKRID